MTYITERRQCECVVEDEDEDEDKDEEEATVLRRNQLHQLHQSMPALAGTTRNNHTRTCGTRTLR